MIRLLMWMILIYIIKSSSQTDCKKDILESTVFECKFLHHDSKTSLQCDSVISDEDPSARLFYILELFWKGVGETRNANESLFQTYLSSTLASESAFYECESISRYVISIDPSVMSEYCKKYDHCLEQMSKFIHESSVEIVEISNTNNSNIFRILNEFHFVTDINVHDNPLFDISEVNLKGLKRMKNLSLKNVSLVVLPDGIFSGLQFLDTLDLSINQIESLTSLSFSGLTSLKTLNLSFNAISEISTNSFAELPNLKTIYLTNNELMYVDENVFSFNIVLQTIDLSHNPLKILPTRLLHTLRNLEKFSCSECNLTEIPVDLFINSTKLVEAEFNNNEIKTVPVRTFEKQYSLGHVHLRSNKLRVIPEFRNKTYLRVLDLYQNEILSLNGDLATEAPNLNYFNISENKIEILSDDHIKGFRDLEFFNLSRNSITFVQLGLTNNVYIRKLYLSNNFIKRFDVQWRRFVSLEVLDMKFNHITYFELPPCIPSVKQTVTFSFQHNKISRLGLNSLLEDEIKINSDDRSMGGCLFNSLSKNFIDISHNPLICDCELYPFYEYLTENGGIKLDTFLSQARTTCSSPSHLQNKSIIDLPEDALSCPFETNCPQPCSCGIRGKDNSTFVNCSSTELNEVPQRVPFETTVLYFNRNHLKNASSLNNMSWNNLTELHADYNELVTLNGWRIPKDLRYLSLRGNKLKHLPKTLRDFVTNRSDFQLLFGENDRNCTCASRHLKEFLKENKAFVKDIENIVCEIEGNGTKSLLPLYTIPDSVLCLKSIILGFDPTFTLVSLCAGFVFLIILLLVYYKQRQLILSYLYIHCDQLFHCCFEESDADDDKEFDAFIAYSSCERDIMLAILQELEEKEPHFHICIHERNWLPGRFISDNIISSVQSSKRTIVILSNNFISSPWFRLELRAAIFKVSGDRRNKLIVILADKSTSLDGIDTEIRHVISKRTYLVWGERWFWEKLKYAMPRKSCFETVEEEKIENNCDYRTESDIALMESM